MTTAEKRKYIKPYLRFALSVYKRRFNSPCRGEESAIEYIPIWGLCELAEDFTSTNNLPNCVCEYIISRLEFAKPTDAIDTELGWFPWNREGLQKRIDFCKLQLKIVKP